MDLIDENALEGNRFFLAGKPEAAIEPYRLALESAIQEFESGRGDISVLTDLHDSLWTCYYQAKRFNDAVDCDLNIQALIQEDSEYLIQVVLRLGFLLFKTGRNKEAQVILSPEDLTDLPLSGMQELPVFITYLEDLLCAGRLGEAAQYGRVLLGLTDRTRTSDPALCHVLMNLATMHREAGDLHTAKKILLENSRVLMGMAPQSDPDLKQLLEANLNELRRVDKKSAERRQEYGSKDRDTSDTYLQTREMARLPQFVNTIVEPPSSSAEDVVQAGPDAGAATQQVIRGSDKPSEACQSHLPTDKDFLNWISQAIDGYVESACQPFVVLRRPSEHDGSSDSLRKMQATQVDEGIDDSAAQNQPVHDKLEDCRLKREHCSRPKLNTWKSTVRLLQPLRTLICAVLFLTMVGMMRLAWYFKA